MDSEAPKISVLVPSYNHEPFVEQCLLSVMRQSVTPMELIVIDDGSTDRSWRIIERVLNDCSFPCEFYRRENRGLCNTLNEALDKAKGSFFAYLGSDDIWLSTFLEARSKILVAEPEAPLVYGHSYLIDDVSRVIGYSYGWDKAVCGRTRDRLLFGFVPTSPSVLYRKKFIDDERWEPGLKLEDFDLYLRLCRAGEFAFDSNILSCWRTHTTNVSKQVELVASDCIRALERNAEALGMTNAEFMAACRPFQIPLIDTYLDDGERAKAIKIFLQNVRGFTNYKELMKRAVKLVAPMFVVEARRKLSRKYFQNNKPIGFIDENFEFVKT